MHFVQEEHLKICDGDVTQDLERQAFPRFLSLGGGPLNNRKGWQHADQQKTMESDWSTASGETDSCETYGCWLLDESI